jgi:uncharacterized protein
MPLVFEWDAGKAAANAKKHGVSFDEAKTIFNDPWLMTYPDPDHSNDEERYVSIGHSERGRALVVVHTEREARLRIITCRRATPAERRFYEEESGF